MTPAPRRLSAELSPYLLLAASDPVEWFPFGEEAFARARELDRPIFLNIGYLSCHFCHRMQGESFRDREIADLLNAHFVCIKVDREERPDVDATYLAALSALSGGGGWPANLFLLPKGDPFFGCGYLPARGGDGRPGFLDLLRKVAELYKKDRSELDRQANELTAAMRTTEQPGKSRGLSADSRRAARHKLDRVFDPTFGGFGGPPKFPNPAVLHFLLGEMEREPDRDPTGHRTASEMVLLTLDRMAEGGIFDQIGGGFFRYATDASWKEVHYEKMATDQALLASAYLEAFRLTNRPNYRRIARETLALLQTQLCAPSGAFFSSMDASSPSSPEPTSPSEPRGQQGAFYLLSPADVRACVPEPLATHFCGFFGIPEDGPHQGRSLPSAGRALADVAREFGISEAELADSLEQSRAAVARAREARPHPEVDDKVTTATNGLIISVLVRAALVLGDPEFLAAAERAANTVLENNLRADGGLCRYHRSEASSAAGVLDDYVQLACGLLALFEATGEARWRKSASDLAEGALSRFRQPGTAALTLGEAPLFLPTSPGRDSATPAGNAVAVRLLARLGVHTDEEVWTERAAEIASAFSGAIQRLPENHTELIDASACLFEPPLTVSVSGDGEESWRLLCSAGRWAPPWAVVKRVTRDPVAEDAGRSSKAAEAIVCSGSSCGRPCRTPEELEQQLAAVRREREGQRRRVLGRKVIQGRASATETQSFLDQKGVRQAARSQLGDLHISSLGVGTRRVGLDSTDHYDAVLQAVSSGMNVLDTSPAFALGDSERLVGQVLADLFERGVPREALVIATKVGVAFGSAAEELLRHEAWVKEAVPTTPGGSLKDGAYCLHEDFLTFQLESSCERLGLAHMDVVLLQSPETLLLSGKSWDDARVLIRRALLRLEEACNQGLIGHLGVFSATATKDPQARDFVPLLDVVELAREVGGPDHHFAVCELPINLVERAALESGDSSADGGTRANGDTLDTVGEEPAQSLAETLKARGLRVWAARPLSAVQDGALTRLVDPSGVDVEDGKDLPLSRIRYKVASLEAEFETTFAARLRLSGITQSGPLLPMSGPLGKTLEQIQSLEQFHLAESTLVTPRLRGLLKQLDRAFAQEAGGAWPRFREKYTRAVGDYLAAIRTAAVERNRNLLLSLRRGIPQQAAFSQLPVASDLPLRFAQLALRALLEHPHVDTTLVGLRSTAQAREASALLSD